MNIDLGCGLNKNRGFKGLDKIPGPGVDIVCDLEDGIPLPDNSVDLVAASHILEHIRNLMELMDEIHRVCKPGADVAICVPHYQSIGAWQDPTHIRPFTEYTFSYWDPRMELYYVYKPKAQFSIEQLDWTPMGNIECVLRVIKGKESIEPTQEEALKYAGCRELGRTKKSRKKVSTKSSKKKLAKGKGDKESRVGRSEVKKT